MLVHAPLQLLVAPLSFSKRYRVRPLASTRIRPSLVSRVLTVPVAVLGAGLALPYADPPGRARRRAAAAGHDDGDQCDSGEGKDTARSRLIFMGGLLACVVMW